MEFRKSEIMKQPRIWTTILLVCLSACVPALGDDDLRDLVARVRAVGPQGAGADDARVAREKLAACGPEAIPILLKGMDTSDTVAANWLRTAFDDVVQRALKSTPTSIPTDELHRFVLAPKRQGRARRLALDVLAQLDPGTPAKLIPPLLDDPEFRRDAVAMALADGDRAVQAKQSDVALAAFSKAFDAARDADQVRAGAVKLKSIGREVSIVGHMGFLVDWYVIGPFDGPDFKAFANVYPPEKQLRAIDLAAAYDGARGKLTWKRHRTPDEFGTVDLVKAVAATDDAAAYAYTTIESAEPCDAQIRCGADDNIQVWLNGKMVFAKEEWQNGTRLDRFIAPIQLRMGTNEILVKVCQGPKYLDPGMANPWSLQIRICDSTGKGIALPTLRGEAKTESRSAK
jgi:hypothetical protein